MKRIFITLALAVSLSACGEDTVEGNTYETAGGAVSIEFKSGGKANVALGPAKQDCSYAQSAKTVTLTCEGDKTQFTIADDGSLQGPPQGMLGKLTKKKKA